MKIFKKELALVLFQWIVLGMPGAPGNPVQGHVVGARRHVQEPRMDHFLEDKNAQDHQAPLYHATLMIAQVREKRRRFY